MQAPAQQQTHAAIYQDLSKALKEHRISLKNDFLTPYNLKQIAGIRAAAKIAISQNAECHAITEACEKKILEACNRIIDRKISPLRDRDVTYQLLSQLEEILTKAYAKTPITDDEKARQINGKLERIFYEILSGLTPQLIQKIKTIAEKENNALIRLQCQKMESDEKIVASWVPTLKNYKYSISLTLLTVAGLWTTGHFSKQNTGNMFDYFQADLGKVGALQVQAWHLLVIWAVILAAVFCREFSQAKAAKTLPDSATPIVNTNSPGAAA